MGIARPTVKATARIAGVTFNIAQETAMRRMLIRLMAKAEKANLAIRIRRGLVGASQRIQNPWPSRLSWG